MADYQLQSSKLHVEQKFTSIGRLGSATGYKLYGEQSIVVDVEKVQSSNEVIIEGKLAGEDHWHQIATIKGGETHEAINIRKFDFLRFDCNIYSPLPGETPLLLVTGYHHDANNPNHGIENLLSKTNELLIELTCIQKEICKKLSKIELHQSILTEEEL